MNTIQIRKAAQQNYGSDFIRVEARLSTDIDISAENIHVSWSFESTDPDTLLIHSGDAYENQYLNYNSKDNPTLEIKLNDNNVHTIIVKAEIKEFMMQDVPITKLDENDEPYEVIESLYTPVISYVSSNQLDIQKLGAGDDWV